VNPRPPAANSPNVPRGAFCYLYYCTYVYIRISRTTTFACFNLRPVGPSVLEEWNFTVVPAWDSRLTPEVTLVPDAQVIPSPTARGKLGRTSEAGSDQQARQPPAALALVEAAQIAVRYDPGFRKQYLHRCHQQPKGVAKVAAARKLAVRLYWMLRTNVGYPEIVRIESSPRVARVGAS
jgi:hypothetical protein